MERIPKQDNMTLQLQDALMTYYHALMLRAPLKEDKGTLVNTDLCFFANRELSTDISKHKIVIEDLYTCKIHPDLVPYIQLPVVYLKNYNSYTYDYEKNSFAWAYDDLIANEWSNNMIHVDCDSRRNGIIMGLVLSIHLAKKLITLNKDFVVMMLYGSYRKDSVKVSFYMPREGFPGLFDLKTINEKGTGRLLLITNEGNESF